MLCRSYPRYSSNTLQGELSWLSDLHRSSFWYEYRTYPRHDTLKPFDEMNEYELAIATIRFSYQSMKRGMGYNPLNRFFPGSCVHHLHLENSSGFVIHIPKWLHSGVSHNPKFPDSMVTINSLALDFWVNETLYNELFQP